MPVRKRAKPLVIVGVMSEVLHDCSPPRTVPEPLLCDKVQQCVGGEDEPLDCPYRSPGCGYWTPLGDNRCLAILFLDKPKEKDAANFMTAEDACKSASGARLADLPRLEEQKLVADVVFRSGRLRAGVAVGLRKVVTTSDKLSRLYRFIWQWGGQGGPVAHLESRLQRSGLQYYCAELDVSGVFLWTFSVLAVIGNSGVLVYRLCLEREGTSLPDRLLVINLCLSDLVMGVYMAIIGTADDYYRGDYVSRETEWKESGICKMAGFLAFVSSEVSAFSICLITLDRFLVVRFPFSVHLRLTKFTALLTCGATWVLGVILGALPFLHTSWQFYGVNSICLPLPVTRRRFGGRQFAFGVFIVLNFVLFVLIGVGQSLLFRQIRSSSKAATQDRQQQEVAIARRLRSIVLTDFCCWFPIGLLGLLAAAGIPIPDEVNVAMAIFVLPLNSAINPFLYTLSTLLERRDQRRMAERVEKMRKKLLAELRTWPREKVEHLVRTIFRDILVDRDLQWLRAGGKKNEGEVSDELAESKVATDRASEPGSMDDIYTMTVDHPDGDESTTVGASEPHLVRCLGIIFLDKPKKKGAADSSTAEEACKSAFGARLADLSMWEEQKLVADDCLQGEDENIPDDQLICPGFYRVFLWTFSVLAVIGNSGVLVYRLCLEREGTSLPYRLLVINLCLSDLAMGVYMAIIGAADDYYRGDYVSRETEWKESGICKMAGFLAFVSSEGLLFKQIRSSSKAATQDRQQQEVAIARRLLSIVLTDFSCWFPIGLLGLLAAAGIPIPGEVNVAMAIFVLPLNSAINPFLYTLGMLLKRRDQRRMAERAENMDKNVLEELRKWPCETVEDLVRTIFRASLVDRGLQWLQDGGKKNEEEVCDDQAEPKVAIDFVSAASDTHE
nr:hypothetical protein BaRGS_030911 [Batillaria attramentaria]